MAPILSTAVTFDSFIAMNGPTPNAAQALRTGRILVASLAGGFVLLVALALLLRAQGRVPLLPTAAAAGSFGRLLALGWAVLAVLAGAGGLFLRRAALEAVARPSGQAAIRSGEIRPEHLLGRIVLAASLFDGIGLAGTAVFLLAGDPVLLAVAAVVTLGSLLLTYPSAEWFRPFEQGS